MILKIGCFCDIELQEVCWPVSHKEYTQKDLPTKTETQNNEKEITKETRSSATILT